MKRKLFLTLTLFVFIFTMSVAQDTSLVGAWESGTENNKTVAIFSEQFFSVATYDLPGKKFTGTYGGKWRSEKNTLTTLHEFNTLNKSAIGVEHKIEFQLTGNTLKCKVDGQEEEWTRVDNGKPGALAGAWLITGRANGGNMNAMTPGARKTMKILSGKHFQWIAYNNETKEFMGTGGGVYTTENGKYTETITFFSRDSTRVGMKLSFDFAFEDGRWRHKGKSSKGDPIDEIWTKRELLGL